PSVPVHSYRDKIEKIKGELSKNYNIFGSGNNIDINNGDNSDPYDEREFSSDSMDIFSIPPDSEVIQASKLRQLLKLPNTTEKILLFDVRHRNDFDQGHIKAKNIVCLDPLIIKDG